MSNRDSLPENEFSLEDALRDLQDIVQQLESGDPSLDEAVSLFEEGQELARRCLQDLEAKELRIQQINEDDSLSPFDS